MSQVLVTGAAGFSGSYVVRELLARGQRVVATDRAEAFADRRVRETLVATGIDLEHPNLTIRPADLLEPASLAPLFPGVARVFHTASLYDYSAPLERLLRVNVDGTRNLLAAASRAPLERFVHWSTCGVFGKPYTAAQGGKGKGKAKTNVPFTENSPSPKTETGDAPSGTSLVNDYSIAKWRQEQLIWRAHREDGLPVTVVRPAPIYGPGSAYGHGGIILAIAHGYVPAIPTDAKHYISASVHVADVAAFACDAADRADALGDDFNVVDSSVISYYEFVQYIALLTGRRMRELPFIDLRRASRVMVPAAKMWGWLGARFGVKRLRVFEPQSAHYVSSSYWLSNRKVLATGYQYRYPDVREGLKDTIAWMRGAGWLDDRRRLFA